VNQKSTTASSAVGAAAIQIGGLIFCFAARQTALSEVRAALALLLGRRRFVVTKL
jgi:hypothetical protein